MRRKPATRNYVILRGGLGNQLHQIAAGVKLAELNSGVTRVFSHIVDNAGNPTRRGYFRDVDLVKLFPAAKLKEVNFFENLILKILLKLDFKFFKQFVKDENNFLKKPKSKKIYFLKDWFQSSDFLPGCTDPSSLMKIDVRRSNLVVLHIRLTDFATIDFNPLDSIYYKHAVKLVPNSLKSQKIACYSDDLPGAKILLSNFNNIYFPELEKELDPVELLAHLSSAQFLISSRSSLCWWASLAVIRNGGSVVSPWQEAPLGGNWLFVQNRTSE